MLNLIPGKKYTFVGFSEFGFPCEEIAKKLNIPMYEGDCMFVDYVEIKEDERNVQ